MSNPGNDWKMVKPLLKKRITCLSHECKMDLHCFKRDRRKKINRNKTYRNGDCVGCGVNMIDWKRIDKKNLDDSEYLFSSLKLELSRKVFWEKPFDDKAIKKVGNKTFSELKMDVENILRKKLISSTKKQFRDGIQTKEEGNVIFYAQHATATCCRKCLEEWYDIDRNKKLDENNLKFLIEIVMIYLKKRLAHLNKIEEKN